jgi:uncharacterized Fe-S cluster protein YjdI/CDGSH-type Zn-finger protein
VSDDPTRGREPARTYANDAIEVRWEPRLCVHTENCIKGLGEVFDSQARPWIRVDRADADRIAETILTCPTGALSFRRLDGGPQEQPPAETTIEPLPNGPLLVRGRLQVVDEHGNVEREATRLALCRCGGSRNKPFCDGTHRTIGFTTEGPTGAHDLGHSQLGSDARRKR